MLITRPATVPNAVPNGVHQNIICLKMPPLANQLHDLDEKTEHEPGRYADWQTPHAFPQQWSKHTERNEQQKFARGLPNVSNNVRLMSVLEPGSRSNMVMMKSITI